MVSMTLLLVKEFKVHALNVDILFIIGNRLLELFVMIIDMLMLRLFMYALVYVLCDFKNNAYKF